MLIILLLYLVYYDNLMWENRNLSKSDFPVFIKSEGLKGKKELSSCHKQSFQPNTVYLKYFKL